MRFAIVLLAVAAWTAPVTAQCPEEPALQNYTGGGTTACPCFIPNEEAGATFTLPASVLPVEILRVGIGWGSVFGGAPQTLEQAINIYQGGLPNPGVPIFSLPGPALNDGVINEFDLEPLPGEVVVNSSPFTVTLEFLNQNAADNFAPTVVHDGNGCQAGKNVIKAIPGGWLDACVAGVTGDWLFFVVYRPLSCSAGPGLIGPTLTVARATGTQIEVAWGASCSTDVDDYGVYEGVIGFWYSHQSKVCDLLGATSTTFGPSPFDTYYLAVPQSNSTEGSYGTNTATGLPRPTGGGQCDGQVAATCPTP